MIDRPPPHSIEIEQAVLSACLIHQDSATDAVEILSPEDFYRTAHQKIFKAIADLAKTRSPINLVTVTSALADKKELPIIGGAVYLANLTEDVPMATDITHYANKLRDKKALRDMIVTCSKVCQECYSANGNAGEVVDAGKRAVMTVGLGSYEGGYRTMAEITQESYERYEDLGKRGMELGVNTGFPTIDKVTGGFRGPKLIILAARPAVGKTAMMCCMVRNMAQRGTKVGIFELEMGRDELDDRWFGQMTGINTAKLSTGKGISREDWLKLRDAADKKYEWPVLLDDAGGLTIDQIKRRAKQMVRDGAQIIFIDQLSKINGNRKLSSWERNTMHVEELGWLKKELGIPVVLLAQLSRKIEEGNDHLPKLHHLKLTGQLEEEADIVILGHREYLYSKKEADEHLATWDIAKHRGGPTYRIEMGWDAKLTRFYEVVK